jgi:uncharacterized protein YkwD
MRTTITHKARRAGAGACALGVLALAGAGLVSGGAAAAGGGSPCANADASPAEATPGELRRAVKCLVSRARARRDRPTVRPQRPLKRIAQRHTKVMIERNCFVHRCPGEAPLEKRIANSDYVEPGDRFGYGEVLGCAPSPRTMVEQWMAERVSRRTILDPAFRHVGVGGVEGAPAVAEQCRPRELYATFTVLFAWRRG